MELCCAGISHKKRKRGRPDWPCTFSRRVDETRRKKLESEPDAELHLPGVVALAVHHAESRRRWIDAKAGLRVSDGWIREHRVIEHVGDDILELEADALHDF